MFPSRKTTHPPGYVRLDSRCSRAGEFVAEQKLMNDTEIITGPRHTVAPRHRFDSNRICETRFCSSLLSRACADWRASNCIYMPGRVVNFRRRSAMHSRRYCPRSCAARFPFNQPRLRDRYSCNVWMFPDTHVSRIQEAVDSDNGLTFGNSPDNNKIANWFGAHDLILSSGEY